MKTYPIFYVLILCLFHTSLIPVESHAQDSDSKIYVWEFTNRDGSSNDVSKSLTEEFEESLIQSECCEVLQRRYYARLFDQIQSEKSINDINGLPSSTVNTLKSLEGNTVVFGEIYDDTNSGQVKFSINFESFNGKILKKASTYLAKYDLANPAKREQAVEKIMEELNLFPIRQRKPLETKTLGEWEFSLTGCQRIGSDVVCGFTVKSQYRDRKITIWAGHSTVQDEFSYDYIGNGVKLANQQGGQVTKFMVADISAVGQMTFPNISKRATKFPLLNFYMSADDVNERNIQFRNVKIE